MASSSWFVWTVNSSKLEVAKERLEESIPEIEQILFPTIEKEKFLKSGKRKTRKEPLYGHYVFLKYPHDAANPVVWTKIKNSHYINAYIGPCSAKDLASASMLDGGSSSPKDASGGISPGSDVIVNSGIFKGSRANVMSVQAGKASVEIIFSEGPVKAVFPVEDLVKVKDG